MSTLTNALTNVVALKHLPMRITNKSVLQNVNRKLSNRGIQEKFLISSFLLICRLLYFNFDIHESSTNLRVVCINRTANQKTGNFTQSLRELSLPAVI